MTLFGGLLVDFCTAHNIDVISKACGPQISATSSRCSDEPETYGVDTLSCLPRRNGHSSRLLVRKWRRWVATWQPSAGKIAERTTARVASRNAGAATDV